MKTRQALFAAALVASGFSAAGAGVYKCVDPQGQVVFRDQPCAPDSASVVLQPQSSSEPIARTAPVTVGEFRQKAQRARMQAALTPECRALGDKASSLLSNDSDAPLDVVKRAVFEFESRCGAEMERATRVERSQSGSKLDDGACRRLRQFADEGKARFSKMTNKEQLAFVAQQNEISLACR